MIFQSLRRYALWSIPTIFLALIILLCLFPIRRHRIRNKNMSISIAHELGLILFTIYLAILLSITLDLDKIWVPLYHAWPISKIHWFSGGIDLNLFRDIDSLWQVVMLVGNIVLFIPMGFFIPLLFRYNKWWNVILLAFIVSLSIECTQLVIGRTFDIDDIITNGLGSLFGWILWRIAYIRSSRFLTTFQLDSG